MLLATGAVFRCEYWVWSNNSVHHRITGVTPYLGTAVEQNGNDGGYQLAEKIGGLL